MKHFVLAALLFAAFQTTHAQDTATVNRIGDVLQSYYQIKNALVAGDSKAAAEGGQMFIKNLNGISYKFISEGNVNTLLADAGTIAKAGNIEKQRSAFANFSFNMAAVVKAVKPGNTPVYVQYCPMKKASWLSSEKEIQNPYYGSSMLTCGEVTETIQ